MFMFGIRVFENAWGGLIISGSLIYTNVHIHIFVYIYIYITLMMILLMLCYMVPTSGSLLSGGLLDVILLIWVCRSGTILFDI